MPHQCVRCNRMHLDGAAEILRGCQCGGKLFFYIKKEKIEQAKQEVESLNLTSEQKLQIEEDVFELTGRKPDEDQPVVLDFESIRVLQPGKYELDLVQLFQGEPLIYKLDEGKYVVDVVQSFEAIARKKGKLGKKN